MTDKADIPDAKQDLLIVEAWKHDRAINKLILGDALKVLLGVGCVTIAGYAAHLTPGATDARLQMLDTYHFYLIFGLSIYFGMFLVAEITVVFVKRLKKMCDDDA